MTEPHKLYAITHSLYSGLARSYLIRHFRASKSRNHVSAIGGTSFPCISLITALVQFAQIHHFRTRPQRG